jgi:hypothetical protein
MEEAGKFSDSGLAKQRHAGDALQRALCCGFRQQLKASVDMTSDVKGWEQLFLRLPHGFSLGLVYRKSRSQ